jgi:Na+/proline symporter
MTHFVAAMLVVCVLIASALVIASWAANRTHNAADFLIGNRRFGAWLTAFGYIGNTLNAWLMLALIAAAFRFGRSAIWMGCGVVLGTLLNVTFVASRLRVFGAGSVTIMQVICSDAGDRLQPMIARSAAFILLFALLLQVGTVVHFGAGFLGIDYGFDVGRAMLTGFILIVIALFAGGMRAAAAFDAAQCIAMLLIVVALTIAGLVLIGGVHELAAGLAVFEPALSAWNAGKDGVVAIAFVGGLVGFGAALFGQPAALVRFLAVRDDTAMRAARWIAIVWTTFAAAAAIACGWTARVLYAGLEYSERSLFALADRLLPSWVAATCVVVAVAALFCCAAGPLLTMAVQFPVDLRRAGAPLSAGWTRVALLIIAIVTIMVSLALPIVGLDQALFAFTVMGAAFGPVLLVRLSGKRVRPACTLGAMWSGFVLTTLFHLLPDSPGDFMERVLPFIAALGIALTGGERRRNPDRADRSQETVHDRVPI